MENQRFQKLHTIQIKKNDREWIYVPDIEYCNYDGLVRKIQLIFPYQRVWEENEKFPLVIFIPGAAWHRQEMYNSIPSYAKLAERGFIFAAVQVRESELATWPAPAEDIQNAIHFLPTIAEQFHIDMEHIFIMGNSSGANIGLLTGVTAGHHDFDFEEKKAFPYKISGIIDYYGPTDLFLSQGIGNIEDFLGTDDVHRTPEITKRGCVETYVTKEREIPPIFMIHGIDDCIASIEHSRRLFQALKDADKEVEYYEVEHEDHAPACFWDKEVLDLVENFIRTHCNPK